MGHPGDHEGLFRPHGEGSSPSIPLQTGSGFHAMISVSFRINTSEDFLLEVQLRGPARLAAGLLRGLELCPGGAGLQEPWTISGNWGRTCGLGRVEGGWVREGLWRPCLLPSGYSGNGKRSFWSCPSLFLSFGRPCFSIKYKSQQKSFIVKILLSHYPCAASPIHFVILTPHLSYCHLKPISSHLIPLSYQDSLTTRQ